MIFLCLLYAEDACVFLSDRVALIWATICEFLYVYLGDHFKPTKA